MGEATFSAPLAHPFYGEGVTYHASATARDADPRVRAWEFNGWQRESMSWKEGCYIHAGLSGFGPYVFKGQDASKFLESLTINSFANFPIGTIKHLVMCTEDGLIASHTATARKAENEYHMYATAPWALGKVEQSAYTVEAETRSDYIFQIAGPRSLDLLESLTGESLRDIGFLRFRDSQIDGTKVEVARLGMSGNLAYELHGPMEKGPAIYDHVYRAGKDFGIERLGWRTYRVNHVEGGFPQTSVTFMNAGGPATFGSGTGVATWNYRISGSVDPAEMRSRYRTPYEVRWHKMAKFDHDFVGRAAVEAEIADPKRTTVMLRWNPEDVMDIYASLLQPGEPYKVIDFPVAPDVAARAHADHILKDGKRIGYSSGTTYSFYFREVLSMGCIDLDQTAIGNDVIVQWGDHGGRIKDVRATVERFPYLQELRNSEVNVKALV